MGIFSQIL
jgi:serine/threonine protein kinase